jgi:hypothetical protein
VGEEEIAVMVGLLVNCDASARTAKMIALCLGQAYEQSFGSFGLNCAGTVLQTLYNRIHPPSDDKMLGAISFEVIAALGSAAPRRLHSGTSLLARETVVDLQQTDLGF